MNTIAEDNKDNEKKYKMGKASRLLNKRMNYDLNELMEQLISGNKATLRNIFQTRASREDKIRFARKHVWSIGLLYRIIKIKTDYIADGFKIKHPDEEVLEKFRKLNKEIDISQYIENAAFEHEVIGEWYPFLNWDNEGNLEYLTILDPEKIKVKSLFGKDLIFIKPPKEIVNLLQDSNDQVRKRVRKILPRKFYKKWSNGEKVLVDEDKIGRYFNQKAYHENYSHSPIEPIFDDLALLSMYKDSDYSIAYKIKKAILQIKVGDKDFDDGDPVDEEVLDAAEEMFRNPSESSEIFTQWFMNAEWIIPDTDVYAPEKYEPVVESIIKWSGLGVFLSSENSYSGESDRMEAFYMNIRRAREEIKKSIEEIYKRVAEKNDMRDEDDNLIYPTVEFSDKRLQSNEELKNKVQYLYNHGMLSPETTMDAFGFDFDKERNIKTEEGKKQLYLDIINVPFEPSQDQSWMSFLRREQEDELDKTMEKTEDEDFEDITKKVIDDEDE